MKMQTLSQDAGQASADIQQLQHNLRIGIVYLPVDQIHSYKRTLRKRSRRWQAAMQASIKRFGLILPILIDQHGQIIGGEGVFEIAKQCGFMEVPTVRIDYLNEVDTRLLRLALNRIGEESSWDTVELSDEWRDLQPIAMDLGYDVSGFTTPEMALSEQRGRPGVEVLAKADEPQIQSQAVEPVPLLQLLARGDPPRGDDVREVSAVAA